MEMIIFNDLSGTKGEWDDVNSVYLQPAWESYGTTKTWEIEPGNEKQLCNNKVQRLSWK